MEVKKIQYFDNTKNETSVFASRNSSTVTFLLLPAMGMRIKYYEQLANSLRGKGFNVVMADWRGLGQSSVRPSYDTDFGYKELIQDTKVLLELSNNLFPDTQKIVIGHSLGGHIGSLFTSRFPEMVDGLILIAACSIYYKGWDKWTAIRLRYSPVLINNVSHLFGYFPGKIIGFGGKEARTVMRDWANNARYGSFKLTNSDFDYEKSLKKLIKPVLSISIENDRLASKQAVENLYNKFSSQSDILHLHLNSQETGISPLNHFTWAKSPEYFVEIIVKWWNEKSVNTNYARINYENEQSI